MQRLKSTPPSLNYSSIAQIILISLVIVFNNAATPSKDICEKLILAAKENNNTKLKQYAEQLPQDQHFPCVLELFPRYYWAQNMSHILVKFEFLNSADTSACEKVLSTKKIVEHSRFSLVLVCQQSNLFLRYKISVTTHMPLNFYHAVWKQVSQNTIILECVKSPNPYFWKKLYLAEQEPDRKPKIWWKMVQKYMENTKKYIYDLEVEEEQFDISNYVKKKKKTRKSKQSIQFEPYSKKYFYCNQNNPFQLGSWIY